MDTIFYNSKGNPIAYSEDKQTIYLFSGEAVAYLEGELVYSFSGKHLGRFLAGWLRDNHGDCVFFTDEAHGDPPHPPKHDPPPKALKHVIPAKQAQERTALASIHSTNWSRLSGRQFFPKNGSK